MAPGGTSIPSVEADESEPLLTFAVPDDLLRDAVAASHAEDAVADLKLMPR